MVYGYARVSTDGQSVDAQVRQLTEAGCEKVYREVASGAQAERAQLRRLLAAHRDVKELVEIGAYARGSDPDADAAIALMPRINDFLRQDVDSPSALTCTWVELQGLRA